MEQTARSMSAKARPARPVNVGKEERIASTILGALLASAGLKRRGLFGYTLTGLGSALVFRGATGRCAVYRTLDRSTARVGTAEPVTFKQVVLINGQASEVLDAARVHIGMLLATDEDVTTQAEDEGDGFDFVCGDHRGRVFAEKAPDGARLGMEIRFIGQASPLAEPLTWVGIPFWQHQLQESLRQFKSWLETGDVATTTGQPHGRRTRKGAATLAALAALRRLPNGLTSPQSLLPRVCRAAAASGRQRSTTANGPIHATKEQLL